MHELPPSTPTRQDRSAPRGAPAPEVFGPLLSTVIFGYYGFLNSVTADTIDADGNTVPLWVGSLWILRVATVLFLASTVLAIRRAANAALVYGVAGLLATAGLAAILVWDYLDTAYDFACPPLILLVFVVWNGYGAIMSLREALAERAAGAR